MRDRNPAYTTASECYVTSFACLILHLATAVSCSLAPCLHRPTIGFALWTGWTMQSQCYGNASREHAIVNCVKLVIPVETGIQR
jgi:hypothetical protein